MTLTFPFEVDATQHFENGPYCETTESLTHISIGAACMGGGNHVESLRELILCISGLHVVALMWFFVWEYMGC